MLNGQLSLQIFHTSTFLLWSYLKERVRIENIRTGTELKEAIGKEITNIGSEATKAVFECVKKRTQDCIQSGHNLKNVVPENIEGNESLSSGL